MVGTWNRWHYAKDCNRKYCKFEYTIVAAVKKLMRTVEVPIDWKRAYLTAILKKGSTDTSGN
jgi:hypothetical protein